VRKSLALITLVFLTCSTAAAQVAPPKHESRWRHVFGHHRDQNNLEQRYGDLKCALVIVDSGLELGSGFFISPDGDVVTAFHVLGSVEYVPEGTNLRINLLSQPTIHIKTTVTDLSVPIASLENDPGTWSADLAVLKTKQPTACWLTLGDDRKVKPGQHAIALGFPGLGFGSLSMYSGIVVARLKNDLPIAVTQGMAMKHTNDFLRVQMPISTGISGGPLLDDDNRVIGVVTSAGAWGADLQLLTQKWKSMSLGIPQPDMSPELLLTGHLAEIVHDYASPGYGDAVPISYLRRTRPVLNPQSSPPVH
jgi:S1-C subfamily serine protease